MKTQEEKNELLHQLKYHQDLDGFVQGQWLLNEKLENNDFKGCFYGCTMQTNDNPILKFSEKYDIDLWYCYLTEKIFEGLPDGQYRQFPYRSIEILPLNFDFNIVKSQFHKAILLKQLDWVKDEKIREVLIKTAKLFEVPFNEISESASESARSAAESAARLAARSAWLARLAAESAARSASESAESAARLAAWSAESAARLAARSTARSTARSVESVARSAWSAAESVAQSAAENHYVWMRDLLFGLIEEKNEK